MNDLSEEKISRDQIKKKLQGITLKEMIWDLTKQIRNLDTRETLLQKNVAKLEERLGNYLEGEKEKKEFSRWKIAFLASMFLWFVKLVFDIFIWIVNR